jgi:hypothetical protein
MTRMMVVLATPALWPGPGAQFVLTFGLLSDLETIAGRIVVRADVDGPMVAIPAPKLTRP